MNRDDQADHQFEEWLSRQKSVRKQSTKDAARTQTAYQIPVVVHIIHNGENHATNISDEQVLSQIRVLNADFRRENADASNTPSEFAGVAGSIDLEFVLAKRTPEGLPTNGIVRVRGTQDSWRVSQQYQLKALSYWPAEDYLNIWVCNLTDYLGYAQFPQSTILNGLESASTNRLTDGVVIAYDVFGSIEDGNFNLDSKYNKGRTTTHEVGHFLGLRHIAGDDNGNCGGPGDYVDDTPDQASQTFNCPSHPQTSCSERTMFQNFLDYTNDECMNLFTQGQMNRIQVVLENSPRRKSLLTSQGAIAPAPVANDLGIRTIIGPNVGECPEESIIPLIEVRNYGNNTVSTAVVRLFQDGDFIEEKTVTGPMAPLAAATVEFSAIQVMPGTTTFRFEIASTNGNTDGNPSNDVLEREVIIPGTIATPFFEEFASIPSDWILQNPDDFTTWEIADTPFPGSESNRSLMMNFYDYEDNEGELDLLITPLIDLRDEEDALLTFSVAHARYQTSEDGLRVVILSDCNTVISEGDVIYEKFGAALATQPATNNAFIPASAAAWRKETINISAYVGRRIQIAFIGVNDWGNNLFLDNIRVSTGAFADLAIEQVIHPAPTICDRNVSPTLVIKNLGSMVTSFDIMYSVNDGAFSTFQVTDVGFASGAQRTITLPTTMFNQEVNTISFQIVNIGGFEDVDPTNNSKTVQAAFNSQQQAIPFREGFEGDFQSKWSIVSPAGTGTWQTRTVLENKVLYHRGFSNRAIGSEAWLVSPMLDFSNAEEASLSFDYAYRKRTGISDKLEIRASAGCGLPFNLVLAEFSNDALSTSSETTEWTPKYSEWSSKNVNLAMLTGLPNVRLAFVLINNNGNNFYLDNLELFLSSEPSEVEVEGQFSIYPNPSVTSEATNLVFDLPELAKVYVEITDALGKQVMSKTYENVLNQVYAIDNSSWSNGMYLVKVKIGSKTQVSRFVLAR